MPLYSSYPTGRLEVPPNRSLGLSLSFLLLFTLHLHPEAYLLLYINPSFLIWAATLGPLSELALATSVNTSLPLPWPATFKLSSPRPSTPQMFLGPSVPQGSTRGPASEPLYACCGQRPRSCPPRPARRSLLAGPRPLRGPRSPPGPRTGAAASRVRATPERPRDHVWCQAAAVRGSLGVPQELAAPVKEERTGVLRRGSREGRWGWGAWDFEKQLRTETHTAMKVPRCL